jgi:hypothetical protein
MEIQNCVGYVDAVRFRTVFGWAYYNREPDRVPVLRIQINGSDAGLAPANHPRPDLMSVGITQPRGFEWTIPDGIAGIESVRVASVESGVELPPSSKSLICNLTNRPLPSEWKEGKGYRLPSFFILGAAKCGTTSLHAYLGQHPDVCVSDPKEPFYFEAEFDRGTTYYFNRYFSHWAEERIVGEARHRNLYMPHIAERIYRFNPDAQLIICIRNPTERAISHWWHRFSTNREQLSLRESIEVDWDRIQAGLLYDTLSNQRLYEQTLTPDGKGYLRTYVDSGYYYDQIQRYLKLFPKEQVRIILFEDFVLDPARIVANLFAFLQANPVYAKRIDYTPRNQSRTGTLKQADPEILTWLVEHYRPHNQRLSELIGRRLDHWDFPLQ